MDEKKKNERKRMIAIHMIALVLIVGTFSTGAWFVFGKIVPTGKMRMAAVGANYEISFLENGQAGKFFRDFHAQVKDPYAVVWLMDDEHNVYNNNDNEIDGISPGACGSVSFYVTPKTDSVNLEFTFEILGYEMVRDEATGELTQELELLDKEEEPAIFLNGHILLFEGRSGEPDHYTYSGPVLSNDDFERVLRKTFPGSGGRQPVTLYWVWPQTLSTLVDARQSGDMDVTTVPITSGVDYENVVNNLTEHAGFFLKASDDSAGNGSASLGALTESEIVERYRLYGYLYDQADNDIGMSIRYVILKMSVAEVVPEGE
ncbi:MAG: hypothetical protein K6F51_14445 [Acetatifactor sp.]|nr:hypothetical protein [Acetatifactor sp.]